MRRSWPALGCSATESKVSIVTHTTGMLHLKVPFMKLQMVKNVKIYPIRELEKLLGGFGMLETLKMSRKSVYEIDQVVSTTHRDIFLVIW
jgi:hypothetical protein